jgi:hypothetical protein
MLNFRFDSFLQRSIMTPSLFGEIEVNVRILELLFQKLPEQHRPTLVEAMTENGMIDLHQLFPNLSLGTYKISTKT